MVDLSKPWPLGLSRRTWPLYAAGFVAATVVLGFFDHELSQKAQHLSADLVSIFTQLTPWGESTWLLAPSAVLLVVSALLAWVIPKRGVKLALIESMSIYGLVFVGVGLPSLVANFLKRLIGRGRPEVFDAAGTLAFHPFANAYAYEGFPSGHTTTAFAAAMAFSFLAPRWLGVALILAIGVGLSRVVLGAHYPTDVLAGMVLGSLGAYATRDYFAFRGWGFKYLPNGSIVQRRPVSMMRLLRRKRQPAKAK